MILKHNIYLSTILSCVLIGVVYIATQGLTNISAVHAQIIEKVVEPKPQQNIAQDVDEINLKQNEMRDVVVLVVTRNGSGSGTIINRIDTKDEDVYEYFVLTNAHVVNPRLVNRLRGVNGITGRLDIHVVDTGCDIISFNYKTQKINTIASKVIAEDIAHDLAMLSFRSKEMLPIAKIADELMLSQVRVFDDVFAVGCQLRTAPTPTMGIISQIIGGKNVEKKLVIYWMTSQITRGSSGGGLFKEYSGHYYMIGIPYMVTINRDRQIIPHLARAISIISARKFIDSNSKIVP